MPRQTHSVTLTQVPPALADQLRVLYDETLEPFPDVMDPRQISDAIGYADTTIIKWCGEGKIDPPLSSRHRKYPKRLYGTLPQRAGCFCDPEAERSVAEFSLRIAAGHATYLCLYF